MFWRSWFATLGLAGLAFAQPARFDVASLKPSQEPAPGGTYTADLGHAHNGTVTLINCTLADCLRYAYSFASTEQISGPDWIKNKRVRFDILAKAAPGAPLETILSMLQHLLDDRFQLALRHQMKDMPHYVLTIAKNGPKLRPVEFDINGPGTTTYNRGRLAHSQATMTVFTTLLSRQLGLPVVDQTGLKGYYAISLEWAPDPLPNERPGDAPEGQSIFTAIQSQLGLKLERDKSPVDSIVVERALTVPLAN